MFCAGAGREKQTLYWARTRGLKKLNFISEETNPGLDFIFIMLFKGLQWHMAEEKPRH